jgi:hypothetical protein
VCDALCADDNSKQKALLDRRVAMLTKRGQRGYAVSGELGGWVGRFDTDADTDVDTDTDPTPIAVPNESAGDTQAKNLFRNRNLLTCALLRSSRNGAIIPCWQKRIKEDAHVLLEICRHFSPRFIDLIDDMNERLESS